MRATTTTTIDCKSKSNGTVGESARLRARGAVAVVAAAALGTVLVGCGDGGGTLDAGALALQWTAGPVASCAEAGLVRVELELRKGERLEARRSFACADGGAFVDAVVPGRYDVAVRGIDADGVPTFEAVIDGVQVEEGNQVDLGMVRLNARPARVALQWYFANGRLCSQNLVEEVSVNVYDSEYYMIGTSAFDCESGLGELPPLAAGAYELEVVGLATGRSARARKVVPLSVGRGEDVLVEVALESL